MAGQQPQTQIHQAPGGQASPGYGFAKGFYNSLPSVAQNPYPTYQGQIDPGLSPTMQNVIRMSQGYSQAGPSEILQGAQGSLGRFMTPSFTDPRMRLPMGAPNLFGANGDQKMFNGRPLSSLGQGFGGGMQSFTGPGIQGGQMNQGMPEFPGGGNQFAAKPMPWGGQPQQQGWDMTTGGNSMSQRSGMPYSGPPTGFQWGQGGGMQSQTGGGLQSGPNQFAYRSGGPVGFGGETGGPTIGQPLQRGGMSYATGPGVQGPGGSFTGQVGANASKAWDMGNQANRGMIQDGKIFLGGGQGGESGSWQTYDPNNWGHKQTADMFQRYGSNWAAGAGSGGTGAHSSEMKPWLQAWLGRDPTQQEEMDLYMGVNPDMQRIKQNFANQSAQFDPSSSSYNPNMSPRDMYAANGYSVPSRGRGRIPAQPGQGQVQGQQDMAALLSGLTKRG